jgi:hypothetical protein
VDESGGEECMCASVYALQLYKLSTGGPLMLTSRYSGAR